MEQRRAVYVGQVLSDYAIQMRVSSLLRIRRLPKTYRMKKRMKIPKEGKFLKYLRMSDSLWLYAG